MKSNKSLVLSAVCLFSLIVSLNALPDPTEEEKENAKGKELEPPESPKTPKNPSDPGSSHTSEITPAADSPSSLRRSISQKFRSGFNTFSTMVRSKSQRNTTEEKPPDPTAWEKYPNLPYSYDVHACRRKMPRSVVTLIERLQHHKLNCAGITKRGLSKQFSDVERVALNTKYIYELNKDHAREYIYEYLKKHTYDNTKVYESDKFIKRNFGDKGTILTYLNTAVDEFMGLVKKESEKAKPAEPAEPPAA